MVSPRPGEKRVINASGDQEEDSSRLVIPVTEEELEVSKRRVTTGRVRITKQVSERTETVDEPGFREEVEVERVPVNQYVERPPEMRVEGNTTIIPVLEEVLVVEKRLLLKEEVRVTRKRKEVKDAREVRLQSEEVKIERIENGGETK